MNEQHTGSDLKELRKIDEEKNAMIGRTETLAADQIPTEQSYAAALSKQPRNNLLNTLKEEVPSTYYGDERDFKGTSYTNSFGR